LHGSGDSGGGIQKSFAQESGDAFERRLRAVGAQLVCPDAPTRPYTLNGGIPQAVWFDRKAMAYGAPEDVSGVAGAVELVNRYIDKFLADGVLIHRIGVVGNSMGGALALHVAYGAGRHAGKLGFVATTSCFLPEDSGLDAAAAARFQGPTSVPAPPLFMAHGAADRMIDPAWGENTRRRLAAVGVPVPPKLLLFPDLAHALCPAEVEQLTDFIVARLE